MKKIKLLLLAGFFSINLLAQHNYDNQSVIYSNNGNVGIGTTNPYELLHIKGSIIAENGAISDGGSRNRGFYSWTDRAYGMELHRMSSKWGLALFARTDSDIRFGHYSNVETQQNNLDVKMVIQNSGNVGIGTTNPYELLHVKGSIIAENGAISDGSSRNRGFYSWTDRAYGMELHRMSSKWGLALFARTDSDIRFGHYSNVETQQNNLDVKMVIQNNGNIGIGTTTPDAKLAVRGDIHTQEVRVDLNGAVAPDFVFEPDYKLRTLAETETYIKENKHLPEIPSANEMEQNGMELKTMNLKLLQKVEELTLYTIEQDKTLKLQQQLIESQQEQLQSLQKQINKLKQQIKN